MVHEETFFFPINMLPKSTTEELAEMKARQAEWECELKNAQEEADRGVEKVHEEHEKKSMRRSR